MELSEVVEFYKNSKLSIRLSILVVLLGLYILSNTVTLYEDLSEQVVSLDSQIVKQENNLKKAQEKKRKLPAIEAKLDETRKQLALAEERLPDNFRIDEVLRNATTIAKNSGVVVKVFNPGEPAMSDTDFKYWELPIFMNIIGGFSEIATFLDEILHLKTVVHIKNLKLSLTEKASEKEKNSKFFDEIEQQRNQRKKSKLNGEVSLMIYRSLSTDEINEMEKKAAMEKQGRRRGRRGRRTN